MLLSEITNYIVSIASADDLVNTIAFCNTDVIDKNKENIYPLFNIDLIGSTVINGLGSTEILITIVQERNRVPELNNDKIYPHNLIDNLNECHRIGYKFIDVIRKPYLDLSVNKYSGMIFLKEAYNNSLDGVQFTLELYHNTGSSIPNCS